MAMTQKPPFLSTYRSLQWTWLLFISSMSGCQTLFHTSVALMRCFFKLTQFRCQAVFWTPNVTRDKQLSVCCMQTPFHITITFVHHYGMNNLQKNKTYKSYDKAKLQWEYQPVLTVHTIDWYRDFYWNLPFLKIAQSQSQVRLMLFNILDHTYCSVLISVFPALKQMLDNVNRYTYTM